MTDDNESEGKQPGTGNAPQAPALRTRSLAREMNLNEKITTLLAVASLLVAVGSLIVAYFTYRVTSDTRDIKRAISHLAALATQTKRSADAQNTQIGLLGQQVTQVKAQTKAISDQTSAIKASAAAAVRTANAEIKNAEAQVRAASAEEAAAKVAAQANLPSLFLSDFPLPNLSAQPNKDGMVISDIRPTFGNNGGTMIAQTGVMAIYIDPLPEVPNFAQLGVPFGGNAISVPHGGTYFPIGMRVTVKKTVADAVHDGKRPLYIAGMLDYKDASGQQHRWCFAYMIRFPKDQSPVFFESGGTAYHCQT